MVRENKIAVITGDAKGMAKGMGQGCALRIGEEGARVALFGCRQNRLPQAQKEFGESALSGAGDRSGGITGAVPPVDGGNTAS